MRSVPVLVAVALGAAVLASGCGQQHAGTRAAPPLSASAPAVRSASLTRSTGSGQASVTASSLMPVR